MFLFLLTLGLGQLFSQQVVVNTMANEGQEVALKRDTVTRLLSFSAKQVHDTAYLCWKVQDMSKNGVFILYRSDDGQSFSIIGTKNVVGSPLKIPIANYFRDISCPTNSTDSVLQRSGNETKYYRLVYISSASEYLISEKIQPTPALPKGGSHEERLSNKQKNNKTKQ